MRPEDWQARVREALGVEECGGDGPRAVVDVEPTRWRESVLTCRDDLGCTFFDWLSAVDEGPAEPAGDEPEPGPAAPQGDESEPGPVDETEPGGPASPRPAPPEPLSRMRIIAHLWSIPERSGVLLRTDLTSGSLDSITDLFPGASWHERETHEMFGIDFPGHPDYPDLAPLLLAPEFEGHPLRKDFVLASRVVKPWPGEKEPGGGRAGAKKRAPKRPPGVPEGWGRPEDNGAAAADADAAADAGNAPGGPEAGARKPRGVPGTKRPRTNPDETGGADA
ncbi:NADH-quinone oxidoreductase subunit C [Glycomyces buryatensis]|uniref:NADH-quinone oxidoreductase subunit C n=1 Tax=Glycomyces buryatensis TaxID=2570927 RepID=A0A4S8Q9K1_9ACTN|nr:NADH-quinone oxidoreductase subunit C [Glycomyces buryatensis]THV41133.1 NADH-quinone oxidoreductase subunit C [Glycomyces buryatensis]